jgi:hypothetical protein
MGMYFIHQQGLRLYRKTIRHPRREYFFIVLLARNTSDLTQMKKDSSIFTAVHLGIKHSNNQ